jgi:hypothetical protein
MKPFVIVVLLCSLLQIASARIIIVDYHGGGQHTSIQPAIDGAASGDTVKVWPGPLQGYVGQINLNKNITLMGSGYENTLITSNSSPTVLMSTGRLQWFKISSPTGGDGVLISGGVLQNCVIVGCAASGVHSTTGISSVMNCVLSCNGQSGIYFQGGTISATNCIARPNGSYGFAWGGGTLNLSYSNGSRSGTAGNQGCIDVDPGPPYSCADVRIPENSLGGWNLGNPSILDPDGSRSDMGYFGGPDCPIYPTVFEILISPSGNTVNLTAKGRANY